MAAAPKPMVPILLALLVALPAVTVTAESLKPYPAALPRTLAGQSALWIESKAYLFGGEYLSCLQVECGAGYSDEILVFDPADGTVVPLSTHLPSPRAWMSAVWDPARNRAYLFGGWDGESPLRDILSFDPVTQQVTTLAAQLPRPALATAAAWSGSVAYVLGGRDGPARLDVAGTFLNTIVRFDPADGLVTTVTPRLPSGRLAMSAVWHDGKVYGFGGSTFHSSSGNPYQTRASRDIIRYDPTANTVVVVKQSALGASATTAFLVEGVAYIVGGAADDIRDDDNTRKEALNTVARYDIATNQLAVTSATFNPGRYSATGVWAGDYGYLFGGVTEAGARLSEILRFNVGQTDFSLAGPTGIQTMSPGQVLAAPVTVTNTGALPDVVSFVASDLRGWGATVEPPHLALAPGQAATVTLTVTAPGTQSGSVNVVGLTATSRTEPGLQHAWGITLSVPVIIRFTPDGRPFDAGQEIRGTVSLSYVDGQPAVGFPVQVQHWPDLSGFGDEEVRGRSVKDSSLSTLDGTTDTDGKFVANFGTLTAPKGTGNLRLLAHTPGNHVLRVYTDLGDRYLLRDFAYAIVGAEPRLA